MDEERACTLALRITQTSRCHALEVRRAWSAAVAWQVEMADNKTGERTTLLSEEQFDAYLRTKAEEATLIERAAARHS
jgi:hypothetical protein